MLNAPSLAATPIPYRSPLAAFAPFRDDPMSMLLHGAGPHPEARWSYVLTNPSQILDIADPSALTKLRHCLAPGRLDAQPAPFAGGAAGLLTYEFGALLDTATQKLAGPGASPSAFGLYDCIAAFDNEQRHAWVIYSGQREARAQKVEALVAGLGWELPCPVEDAGHVEATDSGAAYMGQVAFLVERIRAGDLLQCNISRRYAGRLGEHDDPYALFCRLSERSGAPFGAYLRIGDVAIVSNSPERLVSLRAVGQDLTAETSPIKGTKPRGRTPAEDAQLLQDLQTSEKERAENLMIVDLMRNDLSRVSVPGSVQTPRLFAPESFANVHHLVSTVRSTLKPGLDACDLLSAAFPAGSITGAPKIKAMELIAGIESTTRGANYGSIVWLGNDGAMDPSVLIRTVTCTKRDGRWDVEFRVGGGITAESDPLEETLETEAKAASLVAAIRNTEA